MTEHQQQYIDINWRKIVWRNHLRTYVLILFFIVLYILLGLILDGLLYEYSDIKAAEEASKHGHHLAVPGFWVTYQDLIHFSLIPVSTFAMIIFAGVSLFLVYKKQHAIILKGTVYNEIIPGNASLNLPERELCNIIEELRLAAGLRYLPRVFIIEAEYINALASGFTQKTAMVAVTRGALVKLNRDELQAVMAHELSHVHHMDIKSTLTASILSSYMMWVVNVFRYRREDGLRHIFVIILAYFPCLFFRGCLEFILLFMNHAREYKADAGCVELTRLSQPLAEALLKIQHDHTANLENYRNAYNNAQNDSFRRELYIFDPALVGIFSGDMPFKRSTQPSIEKRLKALGFKALP